MPKPNVQPARVDTTLFGLRLRSETVQLFDIPSVSRVTARIRGENLTGIDIKIAHLTVYRVESRDIVVDTMPGELPPGHEDEQIVITVDELVVVAQSNGATPVAVQPGQIIKIEVIGQPFNVALAEAQAELLVSGEGWDSVTVPFRFVRGSETTTTFAPLDLEAPQGEAAVTSVTVTWVSGPGDELTFNMVQNFDSHLISMEVHPTPLTVAPGESRTATVIFRVGRECPVGTKYITIWQDADLLPSRTVKLQVTPARPPMLVKAMEAISAKAAVMAEGPAGPRTPLSEVESAGAGGFVQRFPAGNIYWHPDFGARWVYGAILAKYRQLGGPLSFLGYPRTDEMDTSNGRGRRNEFRGGDIFFSPQFGAQALQGPILSHWKSLGAERSYLGFPTFDQRRRTTFFQHGAVHLLSNGSPADISDAREIKTGVMHVDGAAANGWAELIVTSLGGWTFKGSMRSTGALSYDVLMTMSIDLRRFGGPVIAFAEKGDVEGTLVLGGNRAHTFNHVGTDERIRDHWEPIRNARVESEFKVDFGPGDLLALLGTLLGAPIGVVAIMLGGAFMGGKRVKACPVFGKHGHFNPETGNVDRDVGVFWAPEGQDCPDADDVFEQ